MPKRSKKHHRRGQAPIKSLTAASAVRLPSIPHVSIERDDLSGSGLAVDSSPANSPELQYTGDFATDFARLCEQHGLDYVPPVTGPRLSQTLQVSATAVGSRRSVCLDKKSGARKVSQKLNAMPSATYDSAGHDTLEPPDSEAVSFSQLSRPRALSSAAKEYFVYFKPRVRVEYAMWEKKVTEIYIEGWKVDDTMMTILGQCCTKLEELVLLQLWNAGLSGQTIHTLATFLPHFSRLRSLILDGNILTEANVSVLLDDSCKLENLSLRFCQLNDICAASIGHCLGNYKTWNKRLVTLNLSSNRITDMGARRIAEGLMTNRSLLVLNLAGNKIGNDGAAAFAEVLSNFALDRDQMLERQQKITEKSHKHGISFSPVRRSSQRSSTTPSEKSESRQNPRRKRSALDRSHLTAPEPRARHSVNPSTFRKKKDTKHQVTPSTSDRQHAPKHSTAGHETPVGGRTSLAEDESHPLLEIVTRQEGDRIWLLGNRSLISLNLSRNVIGEKGLLLLWEMLQEQVKVWMNQHQTLLGLKRLVVHKNAVADDNQVLLTIQHYMTLRDPSNKTPVLTVHKGSVPPCAMPQIHI